MWKLWPSSFLNLNLSVYILMVFVFEDQTGLVMGWKKRWMSMHSSQSLQGVLEASLALLHLWIIIKMNPIGSSQWVVPTLLQNRGPALLYKQSTTLTCSFRTSLTPNEEKKPREPFITSLMKGLPKIENHHGLIWMLIINLQTVDQLPPPGFQSLFQTLLMTSQSTIPEIIMVIISYLCG